MLPSSSYRDGWWWLFPLQVICSLEIAQFNLPRQWQSYTCRACRSFSPWRVLHPCRTYWCLPLILIPPYPHCFRFICFLFNLFHTDCLLTNSYWSIYRRCTGNYGIGLYSPSIHLTPNLALLGPLLFHTLWCLSLLLPRQTEWRKQIHQEYNVVNAISIHFISLPPYSFLWTFHSLRLLLVVFFPQNTTGGISVSFFLCIFRVKYTSNTYLNHPKTPAERWRSHLRWRTSSYQTDIFEYSCLLKQIPIILNFSWWPC